MSRSGAMVYKINLIVRMSVRYKNIFDKLINDINSLSIDLLKSDFIKIWIHLLYVSTLGGTQTSLSNP